MNVRRGGEGIKEELLFQISECLDHYEIENRIVNDWWFGKQIIIGERGVRSRRAVFKISDDDDLAVDLVIGFSMEKLHAIALYSKYRDEDHIGLPGEVHLRFPYLYQVMEFIKIVAEA